MTDDTKRICKNCKHFEPYRVRGNTPRYAGYCNLQFNLAISTGSCEEFQPKVECESDG